MKTYTAQLAGIVLLFFVLPASATVRYVNLNNPNPTPPFTGWSTAATNIQDAIDAAVAGDLVLVTNGVYETGNRLVPGVPGTNRVAVTKALTLQSVNGPLFTAIKGYRTPGTTNDTAGIRCVNLTTNANLFGFTLTNGEAQDFGGGVNCQLGSSIISNCVIVGNCAGSGGGAALGKVYNCVISNNTGLNGGACIHGFAKNCLITGNTTAIGSTLEDGDAVACTICRNIAGAVISGFAEGPVTYHLTNCIVLDLPGNLQLFPRQFSINYCCLTFLPTNGVGNFISDPLFVNPDAGDFRLQAGSPCINAGSSNINITVDLDGNPRIVGGSADIGAYEYQSPTSVLSYAWAQQFGLPTDGTADFADPDGDGQNNWQECRAGTNPTNAASVLMLYSPSNSATGLNVSWQSVATRVYYLQRSANLTASPPFSTIQSNLSGLPGVTTFLDTTATNAGPYYYRIGVQ